MPRFEAISLSRGPPGGPFGDLCGAPPSPRSRVGVLTSRVIPRLRSTKMRRGLHPAQVVTPGWLSLSDRVFLALNASVVSPGILEPNPANTGLGAFTHRWSHAFQIHRPNSPAPASYSAPDANEPGRAVRPAGPRTPAGPVPARLRCSQPVSRCEGARGSS